MSSDNTERADKLAPVQQKTEDPGKVEEFVEYLSAHLVVPTLIMTHEEPMILQSERSHKNVGNESLEAELSCATLANGVHEQIDKRPSTNDEDTADVEESSGSQP